MAQTIIDNGADRLFEARVLLILPPFFYEKTTSDNNTIGIACKNNYISICK